MRQGRKGLGHSRAKWRLRRYRGPGRDAQNLRRSRRRSDRGPAVVCGGSPPFSSWWRRAFIYALTVEGSLATEMQRPGSGQHSARNQRSFFIQCPGQSLQASTARSLRPSYRPLRAAPAGPAPGTGRRKTDGQRWRSRGCPARRPEGGVRTRPFQSQGAG